MIGINIFLSIKEPVINGAGHFGGFICGFLLGIIFFHRRKEEILFFKFRMWHLKLTSIVSLALIFLI